MLILAVDVLVVGFWLVVVPLSLNSVRTCLTHPTSCQKVYFTRSPCFPRSAGVGRPAPGTSRGARRGKKQVLSQEAGTISRSRYYLRLPYW